MEERDYVIEFKLHPIFSVYKALFHIYNNHVKMIDQVDKIEKWKYRLCPPGSLQGYISRADFRAISHAANKPPQSQKNQNTYQAIILKI